LVRRYKGMKVDVEEEEEKRGVKKKERIAPVWLFPRRVSIPWPPDY
jgi:hypothetical protein